MQRGVHSEAKRERDGVLKEDIAWIKGESRVIGVYLYPFTLTR